MERRVTSVDARWMLALLRLVASLVSILAVAAVSSPAKASEPAPSSGCEGGALEPGTHPFTVEYRGLERTFDIYIPQVNDGQTPVPLVLNLHSLLLGGPARGAFTHISRQTAKSEEAGYIVVEPDGTGNPASWNGGARCCNPASSAGVDDVGFIQEVVLRTLASACIDRRRIYATGMSNGGYLSHRLACEHPERFAAIAPVVGSFSPELQCVEGRGVPVLQISGEVDNLSSRQASVDTWRSLNECGLAAAPAQLGEFTCTTYDDCKDGVEVTHCVFAEGGHCTFSDADPALVPDCPIVEAHPSQDLIWQFFSRWQLAEPLPEPLPEPTTLAIQGVVLTTLAALRRRSLSGTKTLSSRSA